MNPMTVSEALTCINGQQIPAITGWIRAVFKSEAKEGQYGPYTYQTIVISDTKAEIRVTLFDQGDTIPETAKGQSITIACSEGKRGLEGVKLEVRTFNGKQEKGIKCTKLAVVTFSGQTAPTPQIANKTAPSPVSAPMQANPEEDLKTVKVGLARIANLMLLSMDAADFVAEKYVEKHGEHMEPDHYQAVMSSIFIEANRKGLGAMVPEKVVRPVPEAQPA